MLAVPAAAGGFKTLEEVLLQLGQHFGSLAGELEFSLKDACDHKLEDIEGTNNRQEFTVRERVQDTIEELKWQCQTRGVRPDVIVLAGGGCRLPLVSELMNAAFADGGPLPRLVFREEFSKQRVAHGLAKYLDMRYTFGFGDGLARSTEVIHHDLGLRRLVGQPGKDFEPVARAGTPFGGAWLPLPFERADVVREGPAALLRLFVSKWPRGKQELGYFDLMRPEAGEPDDPPCLAEAVPLAGGVLFQGQFRPARSRPDGTVCAARRQAPRLLPTDRHGLRSGNPAPGVRETDGRFRPEGGEKGGGSVPAAAPPLLIVPATSGPGSNPGTVDGPATGGALRRQPSCAAAGSAKPSRCSARPAPPTVEPRAPVASRWRTSSGLWRRPGNN